MRCSQEHAKKLVEIFAKMEAEVNRFTEVLSKLETALMLGTGQGFAENLKLTRQRAEEEANVFIPDTGPVIEKEVSVRDLINKITFWLKATADEPFSKNVPVLISLDFVKITLHIIDKDS